MGHFKIISKQNDVDFKSGKKICRSIDQLASTLKLMSR